MPAVLRIPGTTIGAAPVPPASPLLAGVTVGPLALIEFSNRDVSVSGIPANGSTIPDLAATQAAATIGGTANPLAITNSVGGASVKSKIERTAKGGLHFMNSRTTQVSPYEVFDIALGERLAYINANPTHDFYLSAWFRTTRVADASWTTADQIFGIVKTGFPHDTAGDRWQTIGPSTTTIAYYPGTGDGRYLGHRTRRDGPSAGQYAFFGAISTNASPSSFTARDQLVRLGAPSSGYVNKFPSAIVYQVYLEDLTASGRTHAEVVAIDEADYIAQVLTSGGRFVGDTWSDPATALP